MGRFLWSPYTDSREIKVQVKDHVVRLRGTVEGRLEKGMAEENAYEAGASEGINELKRKGGQNGGL